MPLPTIEPFAGPRVTPEVPAGPPELSPAARWVAQLMDEAFTIPGTKVKIGLDAIAGVIPVVGDLLTTLSGAILFSEAKRLKGSGWLQTRMVGNYLFDLLLGAVPIIGDLLDVTFKANTANLALLKRHVERINAEYARRHGRA